MKRFLMIISTIWLSSILHTLAENRESTAASLLKQEAQKVLSFDRLLKHHTAHTQLVVSFQDGSGTPRLCMSALLKIQVCLSSSPCIMLRVVLDCRLINITH